MKKAERPKYTPNHPLKKVKMNTFRKMNWNELKHEYDLDAQRLLPWNGLAAPFGGAWCVVRPNTISKPHDHEENEIFICISGSAKVRLGDELIEVTSGDIIAVPPSTLHYVQNDTADDFHMYSIWWDRGSAQQFLEGGGS